MQQTRLSSYCYCSRDMNELVEGLVQLGLTEYEARAYVATVSVGEGGISDISQQSGIPRSRVYDIMERLAAKGFVEVGAMKPLRYRAVDPDQVTKQIRAEFSRTADTVQSSLQDLKGKTDKMPTPLWFIMGERRIDVEIEEFISSAQASLGMLVFVNSFLLKNAAAITEKSKTTRIDIAVVNEPEGFRSLLGTARLLRMPDLRTTSLDWLVGIGFPSSEWEKTVKIELLVISGSNSMLVYREEETRRAIRVEGSIIGLFVRTCVEGVVQGAEPLGPLPSF
jgi:predicted transcriptional regulator